MMILRPVALTSISLVSGQTPDSLRPVSNLLLQPPELPFSAATGGAEVHLVLVVSGTIDSVVLLGAKYNNVQDTTLTIDPYSGIPGLTTASYDDTYHAGRRNFWYRFTALTGANMAFRLIIPAVSVDPAEVVRAGVVMAGTTLDQSGVLFPLGEGIDDPTVQIAMADGAVYRGAELAPRRTFSATVRDTRANVETLANAGRLLAGRPSMYQFAPTLGDRFFCYGQAAGLPQISHDYPTLSTATLAVREIM